MPRELRVGWKVMTPDGIEEINGYDSNGTVWTESDDGSITKRREADVRVLPRDIPREHVEMLHFAVMRRCGQLMDGDRSNEDRARHADLAEVAECLRLLLEGEVRDGE